MADVSERINELEAELEKTPYNKATQHHIGKLKAKIARLKIASERKAVKQTSGYSLRKSGDATVVLVGFPSVGKSTLLNALTNAQSRVESFEFTTLTVIPGTLHYNHLEIQILDIPGIIEGAAFGKGRGKEVISISRAAECIMIIVDAQKPEQYEKILGELHYANIRINSRPARLSIKKKPKGGISLSVAKYEDALSVETVRSVLNEYGIHSADVIFYENVTLDELIDHIAKNRVYIPALVVFNKIDALSTQELKKLKKKYKKNAVFISAQEQKHLELLKEEIFEKLRFMRIYLKPQGKEADMDDPLIVREGATLEDLCRKIHKSFVGKFRYANVWGRSAKFPGQKVGKKHELQDNDVVTLILEK